MQIIWDKPVAAGEKLIFGPLEARRFLSEWPGMKGMNFAAADACVLRALDRRSSPDEARELFEIFLATGERTPDTDYKLAG
ncbi:Protein of unknown function [Rhizobium sp. NFR07]|jgi:hypothetical protein|uniref:DUF982 domain-containing protein n=1 Tax=Rhizobium sp. NFR07 TaxID=1566262 RepID=UPI0008DF758D|nr:DUF982 domain-containing protein [Rhizobium sp. NFR07]SFB62517.1 Protein of unknown function [Rhizobium sp. NFR07]